MLIARDGQRVAFFLLNDDRRDFLRQNAILLRCRRLQLTRECELVLVFAADVEVGSDILRRLRHGVDAVPFFHQAVDEAPADRGVLDGGVTRKRAICLAHHKRSARHRLDAAGDHQAVFARFDCARGRADRIHARAAQPVDGGAWHLLRQAGQQQRHAGDVAIVFAGLVGAAENDFLHRCPVHLWITVHQCA